MHMNHIILMSFCKDPNASTSMVLNTYHFLNKPNAEGFIQMPHHFKINVFFNYFNYLLLSNHEIIPFIRVLFQLVGGLNPFEKYARQNGNFPQFSEYIKKYLEPPPSYLEPPSY